MTCSVTVQPSGRHFEAQPDETLLAAAIRQGVGLPYGCKDGACGSCKCQLISGTVVHGAHQAKALTPEEEAAGKILSCRAVPQTDCVLDAPQVTAVDQFPVLKMPARVISISKPTRDVAVVQLQLPANQTFRYQAGQYVDVLLRDGARRSYSMASAPREGQLSMELHIRHLPGGKFTDHVFGAMKEKDILRLEGPFGSFGVQAGEAPIILLASGTGFAPIKAILEVLQAEAATRPVSLYWGCRTKADLYAEDWIKQALTTLPQLRYVPVLSEPRAEEAWAGRTGLVHEAVMQDHPNLAEHQVYACGVPVMVDAAQRDFVAQCALPAEAFFADAFTSEADKASV